MIRLSIPNMNCGHCEKTIRQAVEVTDPKARVEIDLNARTAQIETMDPRAVASAIEQAGYPNRLVH